MFHWKWSHPLRSLALMQLQRQLLPPPPAMYQWKLSYPLRSLALTQLCAVLCRALTMRALLPVPESCTLQSLLLNLRGRYPLLAVTRDVVPADPLVALVMDSTHRLTHNLQRQRLNPRPSQQPVACRSSLLVKQKAAKVRAAVSVPASAQTVTGSLVRQLLAAAHHPPQTSVAAAAPA